MFTKFIHHGREINLYYHKTDGGAEYLSDTFIECANKHKEGTITFNTKLLIRIDGGELEIIRNDICL